MPSMPGGQGKGRQSLYPAGDRGGVVLQGETKGVGQLKQVWERPC